MKSILISKSTFHFQKIRLHHLDNLSRSVIINIPYSTLHSTYLTPIVRASPNFKMPFKRYVEIGRLALINYGKD